jgi:16S rRNA (cytosine1402-N4)-methyltransferase
MEELGQFLSRVPATLNPEGRCVMLTYHSREDRIVKEAFREAAKQGTLKILTKHVVRPGEEEERRNPRSRSAKLRCAEKVAGA